MRNDSVFIIGSGPSLEGFDFRTLMNKITISINTSIFHVPQSDFFISMDYTWFLKNNVKYGLSSPFFKTGAKKFFVVGLKGERCGKTKNGVIDRKFDLEYDLRIVDKVIFAPRQGGVGTTFDDFRCGRDSGYTAIQLAIVLGYKKIYLLGMDMTTVQTRGKATSYPVTTRFSPEKKHSQVVKLNLGGKTHYYKSTNRSDLNRMKEKMKKFLLPYPQFAKEIKEKTDCKVFSCSPISKLNQFFEYVPIEEALRSG